MESRGALLVLVAVLGCSIIGIEAVRWKHTPPVDTLRLVGAIYLLAYVLAPLQYVLVDLRAFRETAWVWLLQFDPTSDRFVYSAALGLLAYLCIVAGYGLAWVLLERRRAPSQASSTIAERTTLTRTLGLGLVGALALTGYTISIGGLGPLIFEAAAFRTHPPVITPWAFLKNIAPLGVAAAYLAWGLAQARPRSRGLKVLGWILWVLALVTMFHRAARLPLVAFLLTIPVARALRRGRIPVRLLWGACGLFILMVLFGKRVFTGGSSVDPLISQWRYLSTNGAFALQSILIEFSFPFVSSANVLTNVPRIVPYRYFSDCLIAPLYLIPQRLTGVTPPPTVSSVNTDLLHASGTIPTDVVSFGYYSLGLAGVVLVAMAFGAGCLLVDRLVQRKMRAGSVLGALGVAWMFFAAFSSLYADPQMILEGGFSLYVATVVVLLPRLGVAGVVSSAALGPESRSAGPPLGTPVGGGG